MSDTATEAAPALPAAFGRALSFAVLAATKQLGSDAIMVVDDEEDDIAIIRIARIGSRMVLVERPGDQVKSKPRRLTAYDIDAPERGGFFKLDPDRALFVLSELGFYRPPDWQFTLPSDPRLWFNATLVALHAALAPVLQAVPISAGRHATTSG
jgi:hypothetical protein